MPMFSSTPKRSPSSGQEPMTKEAKFMAAHAGLFVAAGAFGLIAPKMLLGFMGMELPGDITAHQSAWICGLGQLVVLHFFFIGALHIVVTGDGAMETAMKSTHHLSAIRTICLTDAIWCAITCCWIWISIVPSLKELDHSPVAVYLLSVVLALLGVACYKCSRGEKTKMFGGLVQTNTNAGSIELQVPAFSPKNLIFLKWMGICLVCAPLFALAPGLVLPVFTGGEFLQGSSLAISKLVVQFLGLGMLSEFLTILGLVNAGVLALQYTACRLMWVFTCATTVYFCVAKEAYIYIGLPAWPMLVLMFASAGVAGLAYHSLTKFSERSAKELFTGRT